MLLHRVTLANPLGAGESTTLKVVAQFGHQFQAFPESIAQTETQLVKYQDAHYLFSPYHTNKCTTIVKLASAAIQTSSQLLPTKIDGDTITYGPYSNISPYSLSPLYVHFESTQPFITATKLVREYEVSHWGNVAVEDFAAISNTGAKLKGGFSRYTYQMATPVGPSPALKEFEITLPDGASDVYYKDAIGNISTSAWWKKRFQVQPRYPLFGGWNTTYCIGYNLPLDRYLGISKKAADVFTLSVPVGPAYGFDLFVQKHIVKVILPEGASDIKVEAPFHMEQSFDQRTTYLDVTGRTVVVLEAQNLVNDQLARTIKVTYRFTSTDLLEKPAILVGGTFALFLVFIIASRISMDLLPEDNKVREERVKQIVAETKRYIEMFDRRIKVIRDLDSEARSGLSSFQKTRQMAKELCDSQTPSILKLIKDLEHTDASTAETIRDLETLFQAKLKSQAEFHAALVSKKPSDQLEKAYLEHDDEIEGLRKMLDL